MIPEEKKKSLLNLIDHMAEEPLAVAFSGGVDSSLLLRIAAEAAAKRGTIIYAITADTQLHPSCDRQIAEQVVEQIRKQVECLCGGGSLQLKHLVYELDEFAHADIQENPLDRCYRCKRYIFSTMQQEMKKCGVRRIIDGSNADDTREYRPGLRALKELGIESPLIACDFSKAEVRELTAAYGLSVASRPSTPCMATRFPYGTHLTEEALSRVEAAESIIKEYPLYNVRVRVHGNVARIEADPASMPAFLEKRELIVRQLKKLGYDYVCLDLEGFRSGSMDIRVKTGESI